jgi:hypothetical protein
MASTSPTAEGFRLIFRKPVIPLAEIAWRWTFAAAAWYLGTIFLLEYAGSLPVKPLDRLLLYTQQPVLIAEAIHRIFQGSAFRFTKGAVLVALALVPAWIVLGAIGRAITLRAMMSELGLGEIAHRWAVLPLFGLNVLRAAATLAAVAAGIGSVLLASSMWAGTHSSGGDAVRLCFALLCVTGMSWSGLNWLLSTSAIFTATCEHSTFDAMACVARVCVERPGALAASGVWFGLVHFGAFLFACGAGFSVLSMAGLIGGGPTLFLEFLIVLAYSVVANFLQIGRLAAYLTIVYGKDESTSVRINPTVPPDEPGAVDFSELILSDVPLPAS